MTSKAGRGSRSNQEPSYDSDLLSPAPDNADISDVESFTRTVADLDDDDEEQDMPASKADAQHAGIVTPPNIAVETVEDDGSTIKSSGVMAQAADLSVDVCYKAQC